MTAMIHRLVAGYAVLGLMPSVQAFVQQAPSLNRAWTTAVMAVGTVIVVAMVVRAVRGRPLGPWLLAFAAYTVVGLWSMAWFARSGAYPFFWFHVGLAVVCACVWGRVWFGAAYGVLVAVAWARLRLLPGGGGVSLVEAVGEGLFASSAGLVVGVVALGMLSAARAADELAARLREQGVRQAVDRAVADERARLDQMIHDDVMTTLTAAGRGTDAATEQATARLARETLATIDALGDAGETGALSVSVLANLTEQTVRRVSPDVGWTSDVDPTAASLRVPGPVAQALLSASREAVRNAVRHSGARRVDASFEAEREGEELVVRARVADDGRGFRPDHLPGDRLGVRVSMLEASRQAGLSPRLATQEGRGTTFSLGWSGRPRVLDRLVPELEQGEPLLPAEFPARRFSAVTLLALVVNLAIAAATASTYRSTGALVVAMVLGTAATLLVLRRGTGLRLRTRDAALVVVAVAGTCASMLLALPTSALGKLVWHYFVVQLVLVTLVVRRRTGWALVGLAAMEACVLWFCLTGPDGLAGVLSWGVGAVLFVVMAVLVDRVLLAIGRRQVVLRREEDEAIDASARQHVARVQRALWVADLRTQARSILLRLALVRGSVPDELRHEALMLEATLRESIVARNVMNDELADLTEAARRRGVDVRLVDSRHTVVPPPIAQSVLDVVRRALAVPTVSRLVVRLAPEEGSTAASVLTEDAGGTHLVRLDARGATVPQGVDTRAR
ncbi:sensor histidine kinase [Microlunatus flavus]|uniref:Signal transduction histidine kinase n=1 Tax=Microlunatus flavus TaxID=1036181 RepID=A0A1H9F6H1_9ACTN|nr:ATP-binding protein [Microlunatus flavus]SEQ32868.1 Signal transduction histidine kinase [Microlunatus flavus]